MYSTRSGLIFAASIAAAVTSLGCSGPTTSTVSGTVKQESFPSPAYEIIASSDLVNNTARIDATGRFKLVLQQGHEYRFRFLYGGKNAGAPIVVRGSQTRLDTTVRVTSGGAAVDLGLVTFRDAASSGQSITVPPAVATTLAPMVCVEEDDDDDDAVITQDEGAANDVAVEDTDLQSTDAMALPQNNLPAEIGCEDDEEGDD